MRDYNEDNVRAIREAIESNNILEAMRSYKKYRYAACIHKWRRPQIIGPLLYDNIIHHAICFGFFTIEKYRDALYSDFHEMGFFNARHK